VITQARDFLREELGSTFHEGKLRIDSARLGVEFLGAYLKPWRQLVSCTTLVPSIWLLLVLSASLLPVQGSVTVYYVELLIEA